MRARGVAGLAALALSTFACTGPAATRPPIAPVSSASPSLTASPSPVTSPLSSPTAEPVDALPASDEPLPDGPQALADGLTETTDALRQAIDAWVEGGDPSSGPAPEDVVLLALYQQRIYRHLGRHPNLADRTIPLLPKRLRGEARADAGAVEDLISLVTPISKPSTFRTGKPKPAGVLRSWFEEAERRFGVRWELLAAVMFVESKFGRVKSTSTAGAQGSMQFIPSTWAAYGLGGDVLDPHDAIIGAANYLHASGAPSRERAALYAYNHAWAYVDAVLAYANQIAGDDRDYYAYYAWQVWVLTTSGDLRLTGPGL